MPLFTLDALESAMGAVRRLVPETPAYAWPLLAERTGLDIVVKHENHTPIGAFKARSVAVYLDALIEREGAPAGLVTATRGNHGQAVAIAARARGLPALIVAPEGNSIEKNAAMRSWGGELMLAGVDYDESRATAMRIGAERGYHMVPSYHPEIVRGVATYALELFRAVADIDVVYVPIGMGSGACALITVRDLLGLKTEIVGVVAERADAWARSFAAGEPVGTETARTFADGVACRQPQPDALAIVKAGAARVITVSEDQIAEAIRILFTDTHNLAEGAGAAGLAGLLSEQERLKGRRAAVILSGGNIDRAVFSKVIAGTTP